MRPLGVLPLARCVNGIAVGIVVGVKGDSWWAADFIAIFGASRQ